MLKRVGLFITGVSFLATGSCLAGGDPDLKAEEVAASTPNGAATATTNASASTGSGTNSGSATATTGTASSGNNSSGNSSSGNNNSAQQDDSFDAIENDELVIDVESLADGDGLGSIQVQWQISEDGTVWSNLSGEIRQSFTPRERHVGRRLRVQLSYVDGQGNLETILSPASTPVQNVNDKPNGAPQLVGAAREEDALVVDTSMISDDDGLGNFSIIWQRSSTKTDWQAFPETNGEVLQLSQRHVGYSYRAVVSYADGHGTKELLVTSPSETVQNVDDPVQGEVLITGEATEGSTILVSTNGVSDEDGIASMSVGWEASTDGRNWRAIETVGTTQLPLSQMLVNKQIRARVAVVDTFGVETVIFSQATNTVQNVNNKPAGTIFVRRVGG